MTSQDNNTVIIDHVESTSCPQLGSARESYGFRHYDATRPYKCLHKLSITGNIDQLFITQHVFAQ